jgi:hypothetical protein
VWIIAIPAESAAAAGAPVPKEVWKGQQSDSEDWHRRVGAKAVDRVLALPRSGSTPGRGCAARINALVGSPVSSRLEGAARHCRRVSRATLLEPFVRRSPLLSLASASPLADSESSGVRPRSTRIGGCSRAITSGERLEEAASGNETLNGITTAGHAVLLVTSFYHSLLMDLTDDAT